MPLQPPNVRQNISSDPSGLRSRYEQAVRGLRGRANEMQSNGAGAEAIARAMHAERIRLASSFRQQTPEPYRTRLYERTARVYGNESGPTIESLRAAGKSWEEIAEGAMRPGPVPELGLDHGKDRENPHEAQ